MFYLNWNSKNDYNIKIAPKGEESFFPIESMHSTPNNIVSEDDNEYKFLWAFKLYHNWFQIAINDFHRWELEAKYDFRVDSESQTPEWHLYEVYDNVYAYSLSNKMYYISSEIRPVGIRDDAIFRGFHMHNSRATLWLGVLSFTNRKPPMMFMQTYIKSAVPSQYSDRINIYACHLKEYTLLGGAE